MTGTALAFLMQWWMNAIDFPFLISGKPMLSIPAYVPPIVWPTYRMPMLVLWASDDARGDVCEICQFGDKPLLVEDIRDLGEHRLKLDDLLDGHLAQSAALLVALQLQDGGEVLLPPANNLHRYSPRVAFQVWRAGQLDMHSWNAPAEPLAPLQPGFHVRSAPVSSATAAR